MGSDDPKSHWEDDSTVSKCRSCEKDFSMFNRKHHCRICGKIFCSECTDEKLSDPNQGGLQRACYQCYVDNTRDTEVEATTVKATARQYKQVLLLTQKLLLRDGKNRVKGNLLIGGSLLIFLDKGGKTHSIYHLIDLMLVKHVEDSRVIELHFGLLGKKNVVVFETSHVGKVIHALRQSHAHLMGSKSHTLSVDVPESCIKDIDYIIPFPGPLFVEHYNAVSLFFGNLPSPNVINFVEGLIYDGNLEFNYSDCPGIEADSPLAFDLPTLTYSLSFNTYFRSIVFDNIQSKSAISDLCSMLRINRHITRLTISSISSGASQFYQLGNALCENPSHAITDLIFIDVNLTKSIDNLAKAIASMSHGLRILKLVNCSLQAKQITSVVQNGLMVNYPLALSLQEFNISRNRLDEAGSKVLQELFTKIGAFGSLRILKLRKCNLNWVLVSRSVHLFKHLEELDISGNNLGDGGVQLLCSVIERCTALRSLVLKSCTLQAQWLDSISSAIAAKPWLQGFKLSVADNTLNEAAIHALIHPFQKSTVLHTLDISNCKLNASLMTSICSNIKNLEGGTLEKLMLNGVKLDTMMMTQNTGYGVYTSLIEMITAQPSIKSLSLSGGYSSYILLPLLEALQTNESLTELNVSGNRLGDNGASSIAKLLRLNSSLLALYCDENGMTSSGIHAMTLSIRQNSTLQDFTIPWNELQNQSKSKGFVLSGEILVKLHDKLMDNRKAVDSIKFTPRPVFPIALETNPLPTIPGEMRASLTESELLALNIPLVSEEEAGEEERIIADSQNPEFPLYSPPSQDGEYPLYPTPSNSGIEDLIEPPPQYTPPTLIEDAVGGITLEKSDEPKEEEKEDELCDKPDVEEIKEGIEEKKQEDECEKPEDEVKDNAETEEKQEETE